MVVHEYILSSIDIALFTNIYVEIIKKMVRYFKSHRRVLEFDNHFIDVSITENNNKY